MRLGPRHVAVLLGEFALADEHLERMAELAEGTELLTSSFGALGLIARLHLALERDDAPGGHDQLVDDVHGAARGSDWEALGWFAEATVLLAQGRSIEVLDLLGRIARLVQGFTGDVALARAATAVRAETMLQLGQPQEARRLAQPLSPGDRHIECPARVLALIHLSTGEPQAALDDLEACLALGDLHS